MSTLITNQGIFRVENYSIQHHGILGMKWGVRRYQPYGEGGYVPREKRGLRFRTKKGIVKTLSKEEQRVANTMVKARRSYAKFQETNNPADENKAIMLYQKAESGRAYIDNMVSIYNTNHKRKTITRQNANYYINDGKRFVDSIRYGPVKSTFKLIKNPTNRVSGYTYSVKKNKLIERR